MKKLHVLTPCIVVLALLIATSVSAQEETVYQNEKFELGDAQDPAVPGAADIAGSLRLPGPDWSDIFDANGKPVDAFDAAGNPGSDGIPDFRQEHGGQWAIFEADDVSMGTGFESSALHPDGRVYNATVAADHDIGNAYVYTTVSPSGSIFIYAGLERLGGGDSHLELELNQERVRLGRGGYGRGEPWEIVGDRTDGDLLVRLDFSGGGMSLLEARAWNAGAWSLLPATTINTEGCNSNVTLCAVCNDEPIDAGPWPNHDTGGDPEQISNGRFVEIGADVTSLLGSAPDFTTVRMRTPEDTMFGYFGEGR